MILLLLDNVGFTVDNFDIVLTEGTSDEICLSIHGLQPSDINPTTNIQLSISASNISAGIGILYNVMYMCVQNH